VEQATGTGFEREHWTTGADHGRMTLAVGRSLIRATNEKPRLGKQPGFSSVHLREPILPNLTAPEHACGDDIQTKTACGDDTDSLFDFRSAIAPTTMTKGSGGLCSEKYVFG
jgi:hypothetical protein